MSAKVMKGFGPEELADMGASEHKSDRSFAHVMHVLGAPDGMHAFLTVHRKMGNTSKSIMEPVTIGMTFEEDSEHYVHAAAIGVDYQAPLLGEDDMATLVIAPKPRVPIGWHGRQFQFTLRSEAYVEDTSNVGGVALRTHIRPSKFILSIHDLMGVRP